MRNELKHYGVLGMKWGVRRNPSKAYSKAVKKKNRLDSKSSNLQIKGAKTLKRANKRLKKASLPFEIDEAKQMQKQGEKMLLKSAKIRKRGQHWMQKMEKTFSGFNVERIETPDLAKGRDYVYRLTKRN